MTGSYGCAGLTPDSTSVIVVSCAPGGPRGYCLVSGRRACDKNVCVLRIGGVVGRHGGSDRDCVPTRRPESVCSPWVFARYLSSSCVGRSLGRRCRVVLSSHRRDVSG